LEKTLSLTWLNRAIWCCIVLYAASNIFSIAIVQIAAAALIIVFVLKRVVLRNFSLLNNPLNIPFLVFIVARVLSVFLSVNLAQSATSLYKEIVFYLVFYVFINELDVRNVKRLKLLFRIIILSGFAATLYGLLRYILIAPERITSTTSGYYTLGMYLSATLALSLMLGKDCRIFPSRIYWWIINLLISVGILFTFDRIHWFSMMISIVVAGMMGERKFLVAAAVLTGLLLLLNPHLHERMLVTITDFHTSERDVIWKGAFMLSDRHPVFGFGPATFREIFPFSQEMVDKGVGNWHNDFIQVYMESGLVGLCAFLFFLVSLTVYGFKSVKIFSRDGEYFYLELTQALLLSLLAFVVAGFLADIIALLLFILLMSVLALMGGKSVS